MSAPLSRRHLLQALGASALAFTGCNDPTQAPPGRQPVALWFAYGGKNREVLLRLVQRFNASQSQVWVQATFQGDYFEALAKLRTALAAGSAPVLSHVVGEVVPYLDKAGVLEPLDDYPGAKELALVPALAQEGTYIGGAERPLVALPFNRSTPILYLNQALLQAKGLKAPQTWQELELCAQELTVRKGANQVPQWGFECPISWWFWVALVGQAGGEVMRADGTPLLDQEPAVQALEHWQKLVHQSRCMRPPPGRDYNAWEVTNQDFLAQRAAMICTSTAFLRYLEENARFPIQAVPLPAKVQRAVPTGGTFFVLLRSAPPEQKRAAWEFLRWMMQPEATIEWASSTGYMPVSQKAVQRLLEQHYYEQHPNDRVAMDQLAYAQKWPWAPELFRIQRECVDPRLELAVLGPRSARQVLQEAQKEALE